MALDKAAVAHIAALARIRLEPGELEPLAAELSHIIGWFEQLSEVDTENVPPMTSVAAIGLPMREDRVSDGDCREAILGNAPQASPHGPAPNGPAPNGPAKGFFAVPKVVE